MTRSITIHEALVLSKVTVDNTAGGKTLAELGLTLGADTRSVSVQPLNGTVYVNLGDATTSSFELPSTGSIELKVLAMTAKKLRFYAASNVRMNVLQLGD